MGYSEDDLRDILCCKFAKKTYLYIYILIYIGIWWNKSMYV